MRKAPILAAAFAVLALGGCSNAPQAPGETGVCYAMAVDSGGKVRFNVVASHIADMEHCAGALEVMRLHFLQLGGSQTEITGAYQGNFLFLQEEGVFTSANYDGVRYPFLVRTADGHLVAPAAAPQ